MVLALFSLVVLPTGLGLGFHIRYARFTASNGANRANVMHCWCLAVTGRQPRLRLYVLVWDTAPITPAMAKTKSRKLLCHVIASVTIL